MDLQIGSTLYRNTDGTLEIEGVPQMTIGLKKPSGPLIVSYVGFDDVGRVQVKMVDSTLAFNERRAYEVNKTQTSLELKHAESGKVVFHLELKEGGRVIFKRGEFLTMKAHRLEVTPTEWKVDRHRTSGGESDLQGKPIAIG
jgi:hypothetical protein